MSDELASTSMFPLTGKRNTYLSTQSANLASTKQGGSSSDNSFTDTNFTNQTQNSSYANIMSDIKDRFPEFRNLNNNELELVLRLYTQHLSTPMQICSPAYYVTGALIVLVSMLFVNS